MLRFAFLALVVFVALSCGCHKTPPEKFVVVGTVESLDFDFRTDTCLSVRNKLIIGVLQDTGKYWEFQTEKSYAFEAYNRLNEGDTVELLVWYRFNKIEFEIVNVIPELEAEYLREAAK